MILSTPREIRDEGDDLKIDPVSEGLDGGDDAQSTI